MPRHIDPPPSIKQRGLENYLNETATNHNHLGYDAFINRISLRVPKNIIAEDFGVVTRTIYHWLHIYEDEATSQKQ